MRYVLVAAAVYHMAWGTAVIVWPDAVFLRLGLPLPNYPELWQCLGMMVGVYGAGYAVAASDPVRHWPITFIGLISKILGPLGFVHAVSRGRFPASAGWPMLVNDLIWWVPFGLILNRAWAAYCDRRRSGSPEVLSFALRTRTDSGVTIEDLSRRSPLLMVFLRHAGCTFCREALSDLARQRPAIEQAGARIVLAHMGEPEFGHEFFSRYGLQDLLQISDPKQTLYRAFGLRRGNLRMLFGPAVWWRGFDAAIRQGHGVGRLAGDGFQMPGIFLLFHGQILRSYRHQSAADRPDYVRFVRQDLHEAVS
jgi:peroxiredoxin